MDMELLPISASLGAKGSLAGSPQRTRHDNRPISASLGSMGSLAGKLDALLDTELKDEVRKVTDRLVRLSKARDPQVTAGVWMKDVRELSYDMENCVDVGEPDWIERMAGFKARVKEANERYDRYGLVNIPTYTDVFRTIDHQLTTVGGGRKTDPVIVGLHDEDGAVDALRPWLTDDGMKELKVVSIVGARGIGKTTLAKQLWRDNKIGKFQCRAFVQTAKKADMRRILRSILAQVRPHHPPDTNEVHQLIQDVREHLQDKRYFLIIDDLWATSVWDVARRAFPDGNGSRILTTTEFENVALACCSYQLGYIFNMKPLSPSHSKELFTSGMFSCGKEKFHQLDEVTEDIIRRCGGLPLAILSISSVIARQGDANTVQNREQIQNILPANTRPADIIKQVLNFCYNCLPSGLQTCLLYLSLYPENYIILKEDIMKQWLVEGFIPEQTKNDEMKVARNYFDKLVDIGMIQPIDVDYSDDVLDYSDEVLYYAVHRTVHDFIASKSREENFVTVIDYSQRTVRLSNKISRLSLQFGSATHATAPSCLGLSNVRSLAFIGLESCFPPFSEFKLLRFLTLHMWADQPSTSVNLKPTSSLVLLRSLQVICNATIHLPDLNQGPIQLETLEINARVAAIPANIFHLRSWLHLRLGVGTEMPDVTGVLNNFTLNPPILLDDSSSPPHSAKTINLLSPISKMPKWVRHLTNLCILKLVVRELQMDGIINLQGLPFLAVLSLRIQRRTREVIGFATGSFTALEYFEFRCGVLSLDFKEGAMPNLDKLKLGFNAHRGEQYVSFLAGIKDMLSIQKISVLIGLAAGAEETDMEAAESAFKEAIGRLHYSKASIRRSDMAEEEFDPPEQRHSIQVQHAPTPSEHPPSRKESQVHILNNLEVEERSIRGEYPSASSEQHRRQKQDSQEEYETPEQQHSMGGKAPSSSTEQPRVPKQDPPAQQHSIGGKTPSASSERHRRQDLPEQQHSIGGQNPSASSEQPPHSENQSETEIKQDFGTYSPSINRTPPPSAPLKNNSESMLQQSAAIPRKNRQTRKAEISMEDLTFGLTKAVVEGSLSKAQAAMVVAAKLPKSAQRDIMFISDEFEMMWSSLNLLEEFIENELVRTWVKKIHELAYSVEDCMELVVQLDKEKKSLRFRVLRHYLTCATSMPALDQAVDEIEQLKARLADVSTRNVRYNLNGGITSMPVVQQQLAADAGRSTLAASNMLAEAREAARRTQVLGAGDLTQLITKKVGDNLQVISVWGSGGDHGTASIIMNTYNDPEICRNFTSRAWLKLMHPLSPQDLIRRFMLQFCPAEQEGTAIGVGVITMMQDTEEDLFKNFQKIVTEKRYLVVLQGMSNMEEWLAFRKFLPDRRKGSCIIVSTQQEEIASLSFGHSYQILELKQLSDEHSICALFKKGSDGDGDTGDKIVEDYSDGGRTLEIEGYHKKLAVLTSAHKEAAAYYMEICPLIGREPEMNELRSYTARAHFSNSQVISVWGLAGIGKSALVRNLYCDRLLHSKQFNEYRWVDLSHPLSLQNFFRSLLSHLHSEQDPIKECHKLLKQNQCLIIIDDLRSKEEWDLIKAALIPGHSGSVIIVITTDASVATYCTNMDEQVFNVKGLEAAAAMDLFRKEVHRKKPSSILREHADLELDELILKCGGLPKVIVALAALLATQTVTLMDNVRSLNRRFMHHLETNPEYNSLLGLFSWMHAYFHDCPDSLKPCIFYLSIFPRDCNIRRRRLVRRWIAEGYSRDSNEKSAEEQGEEFFSKLLGLSIIQKTHMLGTTAFNETRMVVTCHVNGFIRECIMSWRMKENFVLELGPNCNQTAQRTGYHLIILRAWDRDRTLFEGINFSRLRSLTVFGKWESFFISKSMRHLRVLDLEDTLGVKDKDLKKVVRQLHSLNFLSLRGCNEILNLPSSLGDLRQLQTLDVRHTSIVTLPSSITKLQKLQYIRAGTTVPLPTMSASSKKLPLFRRPHSLVGVVVPRGIGKLTALHTLGVVNVGASGGKAVVEELKKLTQLRKLGVSGINRHNRKDFMYATSCHVHLESLLVQLDNDSKGCLDDMSLPCENLQSLKLYGLQDKLPLWNSLLDKLRKFDLEMATLGQGDIEFLAKLPKLCILRLSVKQLHDDKLHFNAEMSGEQLPTFEKVKILEIACSSSKVLNVIFGSKSMKNLELLKIDCSRVAYQFAGLNYLSELKQVLLKGADDEIKRSLENQLLSYTSKTPPTVQLEELQRRS